MTIQKQGINIPFGVGLDTKTDPFQVQPGKMLALQNVIFNKGGLLQKRNGYGVLASLNDTSSVTLSTFRDDLVSIGTNLQTYSSSLDTWLSKGVIKSVQLDVVPTVRTSAGQTQLDSVVASNGLACICYVDSTGTYYTVTNEATGQGIVTPVKLISTAVQPSVYLLGGYFLVLYIDTATSPYHLNFIAVPVNSPSTPMAVATISALLNTTDVSYDGFSTDNNLYVSFNGSDLGGAVRTTFIDSTLLVHSSTVQAGVSGIYYSVTADSSGSTPVVYVSFWNTSNHNVYLIAYTQALVLIAGPTVITTNTHVVHTALTAAIGVAHLLLDLKDVYSGTAVETHQVSRFDYTLATTTTTSVGVILRSVGLASKAFYSSSLSNSYALVYFGETLQPSYFLTDISGNVIAKLAYSNGVTWNTNPRLPLVTLLNNVAHVAYLFRDLLVPVSKDTSTQGFYSQSGVNIALFDLAPTGVPPSQIGNNLHVSGGFLWMYDGIKPVEHQFHVFPEEATVVGHTTGGSISDGTYFYQFVYEWTDAQGNIHRSAPSALHQVVLTGGAGTTNSVTINVATLRLTYKVGNNPVRIVAYRSDTTQPIPYQINATSYTNQVINDTTTDFVTFTDTAASPNIAGNEVLYTFGGVVEDVAAPATAVTTLYKSRLFVLDAEDRNLLYFSKQIIEAVPVEMSDLLTLYIAPTIGTEGSTGDITALSAMDDKLIIFKSNAIYYITGNGPDNTGANNDFSDPVFITSTVGCANQNSIVFIPQGLLFQSSKGIWLLGRDLSTQYLGAPVEQFNDSLVESAVSIPETNQVRFTLDSGVTLMFDYFYNQWGTFINVPAVSSTVYQGLHTYVDSLGQVFQETPGLYVDGSRPVLISFTTAWMGLAGLQGFERAYFFYLLGQYLSPHFLTVQIAYDYAPFPSQSVQIAPLNYSAPYGGDSLYGGGSVYGGSNQVEQWRIFLSKQKCEAFQITVTESYDASLGVPPGAGLTLSGINLVVGSKGSYPRLRAAQQVG